jgi:hypothetical protein
MRTYELDEWGYPKCRAFNLSESQAKIKELTSNLYPIRYQS